MRASKCAVLCLARFARGIQRDLPELQSRERFDGLVMDQIALGAEGVCEVIGLPLAVACNSLPLHMEVSIPPMGFPWMYSRSPLHQVRNVAGYARFNLAGIPVLKVLLPYRFRHRLGLMRLNHANLMPPSLVQVAQLPACLDFPRRYLPKSFHYTAPWIQADARPTPPFPWNRLDGRPLVYASLGTLQNRLDGIYSLILNACAGLDVQLVLALGRQDTPSQQTADGHAIVMGYAPQLPLLKRAALVITHGGLNTTLEALSEGLPLVVIPIANDQPGIAVRIQYLGLGEFIPVRKLTSENLRRTLQKVLSTPSYRESAAGCARQMAQVDGAALAAGLIDRAFTNRRPVPRAHALTARSVAPALSEDAMPIPPGRK